MVELGRWWSWAGGGAGLEGKLGTSGKASSTQLKNWGAQGSHGQALSKGRPSQLLLGPSW